jgi:TPR repeat protein
MKLRHHAIGLVFGLCGAMLSGIALAGFDEGVAAFKQGDYAKALQEFKPLADQGIASAQFNLGLMYANGQGVAPDYQQAAKWYRLAAAQGFASAQLNLGAMYANGQGVTSSRVVAYALFSLAAANDPSSANTAAANRTALLKSMPAKEIEAAQAMTRELSQPGNLLNALDKYVKSAAP